jgi:hypothetical protein
LAIFRSWFVQAFDGVHDQETDVGALDRTARPKRRVELDAILDSRLAAKPAVSTNTIGRS